MDIGWVLEAKGSSWSIRSHKTRQAIMDAVKAFHYALQKVDNSMWKQFKCGTPSSNSRNIQGVVMEFHATQDSTIGGGDQYDVYEGTTFEESKEAPIVNLHSQDAN